MFVLMFNRHLIYDNLLVLVKCLQLWYEAHLSGDVKKEALDWSKFWFNR